MPLPFLKPKPVGAVITTVRKQDGANEIEDQEDGDEGINAAATDLIRAIHAKDEMGVAAAIKAAFQILDSEPHEEGEHTNEENEQGQEE